MGASDNSYYDSVGKFGVNFKGFIGGGFREAAEQVNELDGPYHLFSDSV